MDHNNKYNKEDEKNDIKDLEIKYKKLQDSMHSIEKLKDANRIAKQNISQCQFNHRLYLEERKKIILEYGLKGTQEFQYEEINIQNPYLAREEHSKILEKIVEIIKECEAIDKELDKMKEEDDNVFYSIFKEQENKMLRLGVTKKDKSQKLGDLYKLKDKFQERLSERAVQFLAKKDEMERYKLNISKIDKIYVIID